MLRRLLEASARAAGQPHSSSLPTATLAPVLLPSQAAANLTAPRPPPSSHPPPIPMPHHVVVPDAHGPPSASHQQHNSSLYAPQPAHSDNESLEYSILAAFSDMETVFLACISTLLPLIVALGIAFGIRHVWRKYKDRRTSSASGLPWYRGVCSRNNTCESLQTNIQPQTTQILSAQDLVNGMTGPPYGYICETEVMEDVSLGPPTKMQYTSPGSHTSKNANGNIITLTLKNNHLIVETEERAVTMEDTGYQDNGCSVIVEVPPGYGNDDIEPQNQGSSDDLSTGGGRAMCGDEQQALVHREEIPEDRSCGGFDNARLFGSINTGLSQSDLSIGSRDSTNPSYRYGNQLEYEAGHFGYPMYVDTLPSLPRIVEPTTSGKWVEFDKSPDTEKTLLEDSKTPSIEKDVVDDISETCNNREDSGGSSSLEQQDSTDLSNSADTTTTIRSNPNLHVNGDDDDEEATLISNKPVITGAILKDEAALQEDTFQEQQRKLGNGTLTPEHCASDKSRSETNNKEQQQQQYNGTRPEASSFVPTHKRTGSIPPRLIEDAAALEFERKKPPALDIYSQIKTSILPGLSPKFELLQNEVSPVDDKQS